MPKKAQTTVVLREKELYLVGREGTANWQIHYKVLSLNKWLSSLIDCLYIEGNHDIFTCQCGDPGCAGIDDGVHVSFDKDLIHWQVRDPMSTSGYENYDAWNAAAKTIRYSFNKEAMIHNISEAIDSIKNKSHNSAEFLFNLNTYLT
jgi:hypothetical protein